jgi:hypothetical protein
MGLSDKYKVPTASISVFGFGYDEEISGLAGGQIWPGALAAEAVFQNRAESAQVDVKELKSRMRELYRELLSEQNASRRISGDEVRETKVDATNAGPSEPVESEPAGKSG